MDWVSALGGAGVAALFALIGAWIQSQREHTKWLRDRQYEAYSNFLATADRWAIRMLDTPDAERDQPDYFDEMTSAEAAVDLLGSDAMRNIMGDFRAIILSLGRSPVQSMRYRELQRAFIKEARSLISSRDRLNRVNSRWVRRRS
jgi:hypothetical protein